MAIDRKYGDEKGYIDIPGLPDDEPVFIIVAHDLTSIEALRIYGLMCGQAGSPQEHIDAVAARRQEFMDWREDNQERVHVPGQPSETSAEAQ